MVAERISSNQKLLDLGEKGVYSSYTYTNTFLQSWQYRAPVISLTLDPDNVIVRQGLGRVSGGLDRLVDDIDEVYHDDALCARYAQHSWDYVQEHHSLAPVMAGYRRILEGEVTVT